MSTRDAGARFIVMGCTGSGKSQFANCASGSSDFLIGRTLESSTAEVSTSRPFLLNGRIVTIIDTPGFDDTTRSDADVLSSIAAYLSKSYKKGTKLTGVVYMHRITDVRMSGTAQRTFRVFRELCGGSTFKNVVIVTNMWGNVDLEIGEAREHEIATKFFKPVLDMGARMCRHDGTRESALAILRHLVDNEAVALTIQQEIVEERRAFADTAAGAVLSRALKEQADRHDEALRELRAEMEVAMRKKDEESRQELQEEVEKKREELTRMKRDIQCMTENFVSEKARLEARITEMETTNRYHVERLQEMQSLVNNALLQVMKSHAETAGRKEEDERQARLLAEERLANVLAETKHREHLQRTQDEMNKRIHTLQEQISKQNAEKTKEGDLTGMRPEKAEVDPKLQLKIREAEEEERIKKEEQERLNRLAYFVFNIVSFVVARWMKDPAVPKTA